MHALALLGERDQEDQLFELLRARVRTSVHLGQIYELVTQLRSEAGARRVEGASRALQENGGGLIGVEEAAVAINVLTR